MGNHRDHYRIADLQTLALPAKERNPGQLTWKDGLPVDSTGKTPDGIPFSSIRELRSYLAGHPELLAKGVTRHLVTYSTGSIPTPIDQPAIDAIIAKAAKKNYGLRSIIHEVVQSDIFQWK